MSVLPWPAKELEGGLVELGCVILQELTYFPLAPLSILAMDREVLQAVEVKGGAPSVSKACVSDGMPVAVPHWLCSGFVLGCVQARGHRCEFERSQSRKEALS